MKKINLFFYLTVLATLATQSFALELVNAKIVNHKEWVTGGAHGWFTRGNTQLPINTRSTSYAKAYVNYAEGFTKSNTYIYGQHNYYISNSTNDVQYYEYQYKLCADNTQCFNYVDDIQVSPKGHASDSGSTTVLAYFDKPGVYNSMAYTAVVGNPAAKDTSRSTIDIRNIR